jgi:hypothetical protein
MHAAHLGSNAFCGPRGSRVMRHFLTANPVLTHATVRTPRALPLSFSALVPLMLIAVLRATAGAQSQQMRTYCLEGRAFTCFGFSYTTAPATDGGTDVAVHLRNLQGTTLPGVPTQVPWSRLYHVEFIGAAGTYLPGDLATPNPQVVLTGAAVAVGDVADRWRTFQIGEEGGSYYGIALDTPITPLGAEILGCGSPPNLGYPYYRTCGTDGVSELEFRFHTTGAWQAGTVGVVVTFDDPFAPDMNCLISGTQYDEPEAYHCADFTNGAPPPSPPQLAQSISFTSTAPSPAYVGSTYPLSASATSGLAVAFSSLSPLTCKVEGSTARFLAAGPCTVASDQAGNAAYLPAVQVTQTFTVVQRQQTITLSPVPASSAFIGASLIVSATGGGSGNPVILSSLTPDTCAVREETISFVAVGVCTLAADQTGNDTYLPASQVRVTITVVWPFAGFFQPVDNPGMTGVVNTLKSGSAVPLKFSLGGNYGLNVLADGSPNSAAYQCGSGAAEDAVEETVTASTSSFTYDATAGQYVYVWKTDKAWAGTCRKLTLLLKDGTMRYALFKLTR